MSDQIVIAKKGPTHPLHVTSSTQLYRIGHSTQQSLLECGSQTATPPQLFDRLRSSQPFSVARFISLPLQRIADRVRSHNSARNAIIDPLETGHVHHPHRLSHQQSSRKTLHQSLHVISYRPLRQARRPRRSSARHTPIARLCAAATPRTRSA